MPLTAEGPEGILEAPFIDEDEWLGLAAQARARQLDVYLRCCGSRAYFRRSPLGTRHFVHHRRGTCEAGLETWQHLLVKAWVAKLARSAGWIVEIEARGQGWIADVLCRNGPTSIAYEVQWTSQTLEAYTARSEKYLTSGVLPIWLARRPPGAFYLDDLPYPILYLTVFDAAAVTLSARRLATHRLDEFVQRQLDGRLVWRQACPLRNPGMTLIEEVHLGCWNCTFRGPGLKLAGSSYCCDVFNDHPLMFNERSMALTEADEMAAALAGERFRVALRHSATARRSYLVNECPHCGAIYGDWYLYGPGNSVTQTGEADHDQQGVARTCVYAVESQEQPPRLIGRWHWCDKPIAAEVLGWTPLSFPSGPEVSR